MATIAKSVLIGVLTIITVVPPSFAAGYEYDSLNRLRQVTYDDGSKIIYSYDASGNRSQKVVAALPDLNLDGYVDLTDFSIVSSQWLDAPSDPSADIAPWPNVDNFVNLVDLAALCKLWLAGTQY